MTDFFISYTSADQSWAEWVAFVLEEAEFSVIIQAWDFRPGSNFVLEMQRAASGAERTIMILSPDYLQSQFASPEWAAAFAQDPKGFERKLVPVMVRRCNPPGLLCSIVPISLVDADESRARPLLLDGVNAKRAKPAERPAFPGIGVPKIWRAFPGPISVAKSSTYMPKLKKASTEVDRRRFIRQAFDTIHSYFEQGLDELANHSDAVESDFQSNSATEFSAEVFLDGKSTCRCRIWLGGLYLTDGISYAEGQAHFGSNACNEILSVSDHGGELCLAALLGSNMDRVDETLNLKRMNADQATHYLWRRFVRPLEG